jgi:ribosomal protein S6
MARKKAEAAPEKAQNQYEAMFLFPASAASEVDGSIKAAQGIIERHGGKILVIKKWDERKLMYEMKKQKRGLYVIAYFTATGDAITGIERDVNLSEDILRVLVTDAAHLNKEEMESVEPQPIQPREERSWDRPPMGFDDGGSRRPRGDRPERSESHAGAGKE